MSKIQWSVVCPIKDKVDLITKTFPSFYAVNPSEVILCFDNPPHKEAYEIAKKIADKHKNIPTKFLFVDRNPEFAFPQAWVRNIHLRCLLFVSYRQHLRIKHMDK